MPLRLTIPASEYWDSEKMEFVNLEEKTITLEHSLYSIAKWESMTHKPFSTTKDLTQEEFLDYIRCMTITQNVNPLLYYSIGPEQIKIIKDYMSNPMTATWFSDNKKKGRGGVITAEILYWQMIQLGVPFECEKWHLNRLLTLLRVCGEKSKPPTNMSKKDIYKQNAAINKMNKARRR